MSNATDSAPCEAPEMKDAPGWARHLCAEIRGVKARLTRVETKIAGATLGGMVAAELIIRLLEKVGG